MSKNLTILSFFRNSAGLQVQRFLGQVAALRAAAPHLAIHVNAVYGDCVDDTATDLIVQAERRNLALSLIQYDHGGPVFGSTEGPERLNALTALGNAGLDSIDPEAELIWYVESDLIWQPSAVLDLIVRLEARAEDCIIAPLTFAAGLFYDVFCYRKNGARFAPFYPYHSELNHDGLLTPVDSVGSQFLTTGKVARACRMAPGTVLMGFCADAWAQGYPVYVDARIRVDHPA